MIAWMKTYFVNGRSIYSSWVLPEAGLNDEIEVDGKITTRYRGRPPGNLPRTIRLGKFANKNVTDAVNRMISATKRLERGPDPATDPKFELCDRVRASRAFLRCWDPAHGPKGGAPTGETIVAGHERVWGKHLGKIRMAKGRMVGNHSGHRRAEEKKQRDRRRERGAAPGGSVDAPRRPPGAECEVRAVRQSGGKSGEIMKNSKKSIGHNLANIRNYELFF